jgi:hypothetical protein
MAVVQTRPRGRGSPTADPRPGALWARLGGWAVVLLAGAAVSWMWMGPFVIEPHRLPPGPDLAWYTWRAELLIAYPPAALVLADGPLSVFGGGYRMTTPVLGALLQQVGDIDRSTMSVFLIAGRQVLVALALGAVAYRLRPRVWAFASTALTTSVILYFRPFLGYVDNVIALLLAAGALWFLRDARTRWPARVAVFGLTFLLPFTHPPTAAIFAGVLVATVAIRGVVGRSMSRAFRRERWIVLAGVAGPALGYAAWLVGMWGPGRTIRDAIHIPPYPSAAFADATFEQIRALHLTRLLPLVAVGLVVILGAGRRRLAADALSRGLVAWLLPLVGVFGFLVGLRYPYKRFLNSTVALMVLAGLGLWGVGALALRMLRRRGTDQRWGDSLAAVVALILASGLLFAAWRGASRDYDRQPPWVPTNVRVAMAAVRGYLEADRERRPLIFVVSVGRRQDDSLVWGGIFRGNWSQIRAGLPGWALPHMHVYLGAIRELAAGRPTRTGHRLAELISRETLADIGTGLDREPMVFLIERFNRRLGNKDYLRRPRALPIGGHVHILTQRGFALPDRGAVIAARRAGRRAEQLIALPVDRTADMAHLARVAVGLFFLLALPGLLAARWFRIRTLASAVGMIPVLSIAMNVLAAFLVLAVLRRPLTDGVAWASTAVASAAGLVLLGLSLRRAAVTGPQSGGSAQQDGHGQG